MKILVTGGAGFIGGNFVLKQVLQEGNKIHNFDKLTYAGNIKYLKNIIKSKRVKFVRGDIINFKSYNTFNSFLYRFYIQLRE